MAINHGKPVFEKVFARYDRQRALEYIDFIKYTAYEDIKNLFYSVK